MGKSSFKRNIEARNSLAYLKELGKIARKFPIRKTEMSSLLKTQPEYADEMWIDFLKRNYLADTELVTLAMLRKQIRMKRILRRTDTLSLNLADSLVMVRQFQRALEQIASQFRDMDMYCDKRCKQFSGEILKLYPSLKPILSDVDTERYALGESYESIRRKANIAADALDELLKSILKIAYLQEEDIPDEMQNLYGMSISESDCLTVAGNLRQQLSLCRMPVKNSFCDRAFKIRQEFNQGFDAEYTQAQENLDNFLVVLETLQRSVAEIS